MWDRIVVVGLVDEEHTGLSGLPRPVNDFRENLARVQPIHHLVGVRIEEVVFLISLHRIHERVGGRHRNVEVGDLGGVVFASDELQYVRMVDPENPHVGATAGAALLHYLRGRVVQRHERHRAGRHTHG